MIKFTSKQVLTILISVSVIILIFAVHNIYTTPKKPYIVVSGHKIPLLLANDEQSRIQGLSDRPSLEGEKGMLFVFENKAYKSFWMKRMNFPLDIIWIVDNEIIKIDKNLAPEGDNPTKRYYSGEDVNFVLEVNGGFSDQKNIRVGDTIDYHLY